MAQPPSRPRPARAAVVVATHRRPQRLARLLRSLEHAVGDDDVVVVVDDASGDATTDVLERAAARWAGRLRVLGNDRPCGPAVARNRGWRSVESTWVAFTDDDCEVAPDWLDQLVAAADASGARLVQGCTKPHPGELPESGPWRKSQRVESFNDRFQACNLLLDRTLLEQLRGFDETFPFAGEDADLGWRARALGTPMAFAPDAVVHHAVWPRTFRGFLRERAVWAELARVVARHPDVRRLLYARVFYTRTHAVVLIGGPAALVAAATTRWWVLPAMVGGYVALHAVRTRRSGWPLGVRLLHGGQVLVGAAWEAIQFARASRRHGTLVL